MLKAKWNEGILHEFKKLGYGPVLSQGHAAMSMFTIG